MGVDGVHALPLYGSVASGMGAKGSDLDMAVLPPPGGFGSMSRKKTGDKRIIEEEAFLGRVQEALEGRGMREVKMIITGLQHRVW